MVIGEIKDVIVRKTLAYGTKNGLGVFCLFKEWELQIGWTPESDQLLFNRIEKLSTHDSFKAKIIYSNKKFINEKFSKITISIVCTV